MLSPYVNSEQKTKKHYKKLSLMSLMFMSAVYGSSIAPVHASPSQTTSTTSTQIKAESSHHNLPIFHALSRLLGFTPSHTVSAQSDTPQQTTSLISHTTKSSATIINAVKSSSESKISNSVPLYPHYHRFLNLLYHLVHQFIGPYSFNPSAKTLANAAGKTPVILVHGTWWDADSLSEVYHSLDNAGIPAYAITMGTGGPSLAGLIPHLGGVNTAASSEKQLADFIAKVQQETGARKVDLIGHSQGGLLVKDYIAHDTQNNIQAVVDLGATNHGSTLDGGSYVLNLFPKSIKNVLIKTVSALLGPGATDQLPYSPYVSNLDQYPDTKAGIHYLVLGTRDDLISTPYQATFLKAVRGADVTNREVHTIPGVFGYVGHNMLPLNPAIVKYITQYIEEKGQPARQKTYATPATHTASTVSAAPVVSLLN